MPCDRAFITLYNKYECSREFVTFQFSSPQIQHRAWQSLGAHKVLVELKVSKAGIPNSKLLQNLYFQQTVPQLILSRLRLVRGKVCVIPAGWWLALGREPAQTVHLRLFLSCVLLTLP